MKVSRSNAQFLCFFMAVLILIVSIPCQSVLAALIGTETVLGSVRGQKAHDQLKQFFARQDVRTALIAHGIDPIEAKRRINALSDDEAIRIADQIDNLPAGGNTLVLMGGIIIAAMIIWYAIILFAVKATDK